LKILAYCKCKEKYTRKGAEKMYDVQDVAEYVITYSEVKDYGISNLKLQKILYLIQAYSLIHTKKPCFSEDIEAWDFGPVIPEVYRKYKQFGSTDIQIRFRRLEEVQKGFEREDRKRIEEVVDRFADFSAAPWQVFEKAERCPSLASLFPPQAAVGSAVVRIHPPSESGFAVIQKPQRTCIR